ncbi:MAG: selenium cofactor biosynthesis protein YqeC, partial [Ardenticatenaceae bacterium]
MPQAMAYYPLTRAFRLDTFEGKPVVAFVGGGGKTTAMFMLADELAAQGRRVVTTTTTRLFASQRAQSPAWCPTGELASLSALLDEHGQCLITAGDGNWKDGKAHGLAPEQVMALATRDDVAAVLVEADGSRVRPFKAPAEHEPVLPAGATHVVVLVGADVFGKPLSAEHVHRPERVSTLGGVALGTPVTPDLVVRILSHPQGGLQYVPDQAHYLPFLNKVEEPADIMQAEETADLLLAHPRPREVLLASLHTLRQSEIVPRGRIARSGGHPKANPPQGHPKSPPKGAFRKIQRRSRSAAILLAAGASTRYGESKQLLEWQGRTLVEHAVMVALEVCETVLVVVGHDA